MDGNICKSRVDTWIVCVQIHTFVIRLRAARLSGVLLMMMMCRYCCCIWFDWWNFFLRLRAIRILFILLFLFLLPLLPLLLKCSSFFYFTAHFFPLIVHHTVSHTHMLFSARTRVTFSRLFAIETGVCLFDGTLNTISTILNTAVVRDCMWTGRIVVTFFLLSFFESSTLVATTFVISICLFSSVEIMLFCPPFGQLVCFFHVLVFERFGGVRMRER